jgi:VanZ family protein
MRPIDLRLAKLPQGVRVAIYALACLILLYLTLAPGEDVPGEGLIWDKAEHAISWAVLTGAGLLLSTHRRWVIPVFAFIFGAVIEVLQATMGLGRDGDWHDLAADTVGIAVAWVVWRLLLRAGWVR